MAKITSRYVPDHASMRAFLLDDHRTGDVAATAGADIHDDVWDKIVEEYEDTGAMRNAWEVRRAVGGGYLEGGPRRIAVLYSEDPAALMNELGSKTVPPRHILMNEAMKYDTPRRLGRR